MKRLTTHHEDIGICLVKGTAIGELAHRLYQFEEAMDEKTLKSLHTLRGYCKGADFKDEAAALDNSGREWR